MAGSEDFKLDPITFNPYKALDLSEDATPAQIKLAYRRLVLTTHPDKIQDEAERQRRDGEFHNVQTAFDILRSEDRRRQWDERVKLANAWKAREQPTPRRAQTQDYTPTRPRYTPARYETYDGRMYEERVPKSSSRAYEDDFFSARFAESRPSPKKFEDRYADPPSRKTSGRGPDDRRASKESDVSRAKKEETYLREQSKKKRDIEKKKGHADSINRKKVTVEDDYSSESDVDRYYSSRSESKSKPRDYTPRNVREVPVRSSKGFTYEDEDEELKPKVRGVEDYISKAESRGPRRRADTYQERPAPPPSPPYSYDAGRRSSGDDGRRSSGKARSGREISPPRKSTKEKRPRDMVDQPSSPRTRVPNSSSDPRPLKDMVPPSKSRGEPRGEPQRAATFQPEAEFKKPQLKRAETLPSRPAARREPTSSGSHLKRSTRPPPSDSESSDTSDSDSDATPIVESPAPRSRKSPPRPPPSTKYNYKVALDEESRSPRTIYMDPEEVYSSRDSSPRNPRRSSEHPPLPTRPAPSTRTQSVRSPYIPAESPVPSPRQSYTRTPSSRKAPPLQTHTSSRSPKTLFGAVDEREYSPKSAHHSPKASYVSPREESFSRRGSADKPFDDYPGSHSKSHRRPQRPAVY